MEVGSVSRVFDLARTGRAARVGTRVARIARMIFSNLAVWKKVVDSQHSPDNKDENELKVGKVHNDEI